MTPRRRRMRMLVAVAALGALACGIREDELSCEEAVAHLADCCPDFNTDKIGCQHGCDDNVVGTSFDTAQSHCIQEMPCDRLRATDVCGRAQDPYASRDTGVCP
jgi:hypothetical protein